MIGTSAFNHSQSRLLVASLHRQLRARPQRLRVELNRVGRALLAGSHRLPITIAM